MARRSPEILAPTSHRPVKGCMLLGVPLSVKILNPTSIAPPERLYKHARLGYPKPMACLMSMLANTAHP